MSLRDFGIAQEAAYLAELGRFFGPTLSRAAALVQAKPNRAAKNGMGKNTKAIKCKT